MTSFIFNSALNDVIHGAIDFERDEFKCMLVTGQPDKQAHTRRSDITGEIEGQGYTAGGLGVAVIVNRVGDRVEVTLGEARWRPASITATGAVYYKSRGGLDSLDELVAFIDFGGDVSSTNGPFNLSASVLRITN